MSTIITGRPGFGHTMRYIDLVRASKLPGGVPVACLRPHLRVDHEPRTSLPEGGTIDLDASLSAVAKTAMTRQWSPAASPV